MSSEQTGPLKPITGTTHFINPKTVPPRSAEEAAKRVEEAAKRAERAEEATGEALRAEGIDLRSVSSERLLRGEGEGQKLAAEGQQLTRTALSSIRSLSSDRTLSTDSVPETLLSVPGIGAEGPQYGLLDYEIGLQHEKAPKEEPSHSAFAYAYAILRTLKDNEEEVVKEALFFADQVVTNPYGIGEQIEELTKKQIVEFREEEPPHARIRKSEQLVQNLEKIDAEEDQIPAEIEDLKNKMDRLRKDCKLVLTPSGELVVSKRHPNLLSYILTRTGASIRSKNAAQKCLQRMWELASTESNRAPIKEALKSLSQSEWFRGVLRHHPDIAENLLTTIKTVYGQSPDDVCRLELIEISACARDVETAGRFALLIEPQENQDLETLGARVDNLEKQIQPDELKKRITSRAPLLSPEEIHSIALLKRDIDFLCEKSRNREGALPEDLEKVRAKFETLKTRIPGLLGSSVSPREQTLSIFRDVCFLATPFDKKNSPLFSVAQDRLAEYKKLVKQELKEGANDPEKVHSIFEEASNFLAGPDKEMARREMEEVIQQCQLKYVDLAGRLMETALSPIEALTEDGSTSQQEAANEFSIVMSRLLPKTQNAFLEGVGRVLPTAIQVRPEVAITFIRELSRTQREELQHAVESTGEAGAELFDIIRRENVRTSILLASDREFLNKELLRTPKGAVQELLDETKGSVYSLSRYAGSRMDVISAVTELFKDLSPDSRTQVAKNFLLPWLQSLEKIPEEETQRSSEETIDIKKRVLEEVLPLFRQNPLLEASLQNAAQALYSPATEPSLPSGNTPMDEVLEKALSTQRGSEEYKGRVEAVSEDLFQISASYLRAVSPASLVVSRKTENAFLIGIIASKLYLYVSESIRRNPKTSAFWMDVLDESMRRGDLNTAMQIYMTLAIDEKGLSEPDKAKLQQLKGLLYPSEQIAQEEWMAQRLGRDEPVIPFTATFSSNISGLGENKDSTGKPTPFIIGAMGKQVRQVRVCMDSIGASQPLTTDIIEKILAPQPPKTSSKARSESPRTEISPDQGVPAATKPKENPSSASLEALINQEHKEEEVELWVSPEDIKNVSPRERGLADIPEDFVGLWDDLFLQNYRAGLEKAKTYSENLQPALAFAYAVAKRKDKEEHTIREQLPFAIGMNRAKDAEERKDLIDRLYTPTPPEHA